MSDRHLPVRPNFTQLKHPAKDLLRDMKRARPDAKLAASPAGQVSMCVIADVAAAHDELRYARARWQTSCSAGSRPSMLVTYARSRH
jgi:hypothetical protein